jgi:hypothetical protein
VSTGPVHDLLHRDHLRLAGLLEEACRGSTVDAAAFQAFRTGLLRHIGMEEKILLPAAKRLRGGESLPLAKQMKLDHSALAALLVPTPTPAIVERIRTLLDAHNVMEEREGGVYEQCERCAAGEADALARELERAAEVKLAPHCDTPRVFASIERLLRATGRN